MINKLTKKWRPYPQCFSSRSPPSTLVNQSNILKQLHHSNNICNEKPWSSSSCCCSVDRMPGCEQLHVWCCNIFDNNNGDNHKLYSTCWKVCSIEGSCVEPCGMVQCPGYFPLQPWTWWNQPMVTCTLINTLPSIEQASQSRAQSPQWEQPLASALPSTSQVLCLLARRASCLVSQGNVPWW